MSQQNTDDSGDSLHGAIAEIALMRAEQLALTGNLDDAAEVLKHAESGPASPAALDLLARIACQKGEYAQAAKLWQAVLDKDPSDEVARAALVRLESPWLAFSICRRLSLLTVLAIVLAFSMVGIYALIEGLRPVELEPSTTGSTHAHKSGTAHVERGTKGVGETLAGRLPFFSVDGCAVSTNDTETRIVFLDGLFSRYCEFAEAAQERLGVVGRTVATHATGCWVVVEGHTDSTPVSSDSVYVDNFGLGLQRAVTVVEVLKATCAILPKDILVVSAGGQTILFPESDSGSRLKNRTVVIRLVPKTVGRVMKGNAANEPSR